MNAKHSPEPWAVGYFKQMVVEDAKPGHGIARCQIGADTESDTRFWMDENEANAARIVACVNALAPGGPVARLAEAVEWALTDGDIPDDAFRTLNPAWEALNALLRPKE